MRYVNINNLVPGMILGKNIESTMPNGNTMVLARANMVLTQSIINILEKKDYKGVYIKDDFTKDIEVGETISQEVQKATLKSIRNKDITAIIEESKKIADEIYGNRKLRIDLIRMIETSDIESHSLNVCELAINLARLNPQFDYSKIAELSSACLLHDIGKLLNKNDLSKIQLPEVLESKASTISKDEKYFFHPIYAFYYLRNYFNVSAVARKAILFHHECTNGKGFPTGALEKDIPEIAKIIGVCDRYDHYLETYGNPIDARIKLSEDYAVGTIDRFYGELLLRYIPIFPIASMVELSNGDKAVIVDYNKSFPERPIVRSMSSGENINLADFNFINITISKLFIGNNIVEFNNNESDLLKK